MICYQAKGEIKHIRVTNAADGQYSLGKSKNTFGQIWDLIEAQIDQQLKSTKGDTEVQVNMMPPQSAFVANVPSPTQHEGGTRPLRTGVPAKWVECNAAPTVRINLERQRGLCFNFDHPADLRPAVTSPERSAAHLPVGRRGGSNGT